MVPIEPHLFALETLSKLDDLLKIVGNTPFFVVVNKAPVQGSEGINAADFVRQQGFTVAPVIVHVRAAHRHAGNVGKTASEYERNGKAAEETLQLYAYTLKLIDTQRRANAKGESAHARA